MDTFSKRTAWVRDAIGGRPAVRFDGVDDYLATAGSQGLDFSGGFTAFFLLKRINYNNTGGPFTCRADGKARTQQTLEFYEGAGGGSWTLAANRSPGSIGFWSAAGFDTTTAPALMSVRMDEALAFSDGPVRRNGGAFTVAETSVARAPEDTVDIIEMGGGYNGAKLNANIYTVVFYVGRAMTLAEQQAADASIIARFGVS